MKLASVILTLGVALLSYGKPAQAQIAFNSPTQLIDNDANQGSPTLVYFGADLCLYYVNHSNNTIYVDVNLTGNPQSTGIVVNSAELTDVGAAVLSNGDILISYVDTNNNLEFATSFNGINFGGGFTPPNSELGLGNVGPNTAFIPALTSNGTTVYVGTVGTDGMVYMSSTTDGGTFTPLNGEGISVSPDATVSRPSLTIFNGDPWVAFTTNAVGTRNAVVGDAINGSAGPVATSVSWGNNNRSGNYAGVALFNYNSVLYVYGQDTASSQQLKSIDSGDGVSWSGSTNAGNQMRWTPSLAISSTNTAYLVYQDDGNTNISYRHN